MIQPITLVYISNRKKFPYYVFKFVENNGRILAFSIIIFLTVFRFVLQQNVWYFLAALFIITFLYNTRNYFSLEIRKGFIQLTNEGIIIEDKNGKVLFKFEDIKQLSVMYEYDTYIEQEKINDSRKLRVYSNYIFITTNESQLIYPFLIDKKYLFRTINGILKDYKNNHQVDVKRLSTGDELVAKEK